MLKFMRSSENINSNGGFSFVQRILDGNKEMQQWDVRHRARWNARYSTLSIVRAMVGLMTAGECDYSSIDRFRTDSLYRELVGGPLPSEASFRQRLSALACESWQNVLDDCVSSMLSRVTLTPIMKGGLSLIPVDIDVSVLEDTASAKEGVSMSYHNVKGYAPIFCYAGREGYMVANELRPGSQHCENGAVDFVKRCVGILEKAGYKAENLLVRVDSGHDSCDFLKALSDLKVHYLVKRNLRREVKEQLLDSIRGCESTEKPRQGKCIHRGIRSDRKPANFPEFNGFMLVEATERTSLADGQELLFPEIELDSWWTNLPFEVKPCVELYHDHGTSEQFHSELKSDMGMELLPSGSMKTNSLVLGLATIAFNCLRIIGQKALEYVPAPSNEDKRIFRYRLRTVLLDYIKVGCKLVYHARTVFLIFGKECLNFQIMKKIYNAC